MSTDTDYVITIKGKDAALRKAAADYIELLLHPWSPERNDKKTLVRIDVFRNESNSGGFLTPGSLCEDATKLFPGTDVSFESKNEHGHTKDGHWNEAGETPKDPASTLVYKALERIQSDVVKLENQLTWLTPLAEWAAVNKIPKNSMGKVETALKKAEAAQKEATKAREIEAEHKNEVIIKGVEALEAAIRWCFHPISAVKTRKIGHVAQSTIYQSCNGYLDDSKSTWGTVWTSLNPQREGGTFKEGLNKGCQEVGLGTLLMPDAKVGEKFLDSQVYIPSKFLRGPKVLIRSAKGIRAIGAEIRKIDGAYLWIHSTKQTSEDAFHLNIQKSLRLSKRLEDSTVEEVLHDEDLCDDQSAFGQSLGGLRGNCFAVKGSQLFIASGNIIPKGQPLGRIFALSVSDGSVLWTSELRFHECKALSAPDPSTLLAALIIDKSLVLFCLDTATGKEKWRAVLDETGSSSFPSLQLAASKETAVLLSKNSDDWHLSWWRISSGKKVLEKVFTDEPRIVMDSNLVYASGNDWVTTFTHEGEDAWSISQPEGDTWGLCLTGKGTALISRGEQGVVCLNCETGSTVWASEDSHAWSCIVGSNEVAYSTTGYGFIARSLHDGSLIWQTKESDREDFSRMPAVVTDRALIGVARNRTTDEGFLEWFDIQSGTQLGSVGLSSNSDVVAAQDGSLFCVGSFWTGTSQMVCLDIKLGPPRGTWPMKYQGEGCTNYLPTPEKSGFKQFVEAWKSKEDLSPRLLRLGSSSGDDGTKTARIHGILRGHELVAQAKLWAEPTIGPGKTAPARGRQWRLVMAYGGLELLVKSLSAPKGNGLDERTLSDLFSKLTLPPFEALKPPSPEKSSLKEWIEEEDASDVLDFLRMENGDRGRFDAWLIKQQPATTWVEGILLAKALRSATAHGALSPTKVMEWKLSEAFSRLTEDISRVDEGVFEALGKTL